MRIRFADTPAHQQERASIAQRVSCRELQLHRCAIDDICEEVTRRCAYREELVKMSEETGLVQYRDLRAARESIQEARSRLMQYLTEHGF